MSELQRLKNLSADYRRKLKAMQGHVFFIQDEDGMLRRWTPPRANSVFETPEKEPGQ